MRSLTLKRDVGWLGSFAMGYGDVGADIFVALGIVFLYAAGAAPIAFLIAALTYICIGLVYAELSSIYPYAGGCQVFALRAFNSMIGFLAGWAIMLDYTVNISLFALAAVGYLKFLIPELFSFSITVLGLSIPSMGVIAAIIICILILLNYVGIRYSVNFLISLVIFGLSIIVLVIVIGYAFIFDPNLLINQIGIFGNQRMFAEVGYLFLDGSSLNNFLYGITIAMVSFIGIESISQGAEETRKPYKWIPRAAKLSVVAVTLSVLLMSILVAGSMDWVKIAESYENPIAVLVSTFPTIGNPLSIFVALAAFILCVASSNTGVIGASRLVMSMSKFRLMPKWFYFIHPKYRTPTKSILIFGGIGAALALVGDIPIVASIYNFGALLSYVILMASFLKLRLSEREVYRPWKTPLNVKINLGSRDVEVPLIGLYGIISTSILWILVILLHPHALQFGSIWMVIGLVMYYLFRRYQRLHLLSKEESEWIVPSSYMLDVTVLVDAMGEYHERLDKIIKRCYDKRFRIRLLAIVPKEITFKAEANLTDFIASIHHDLEVIANMLRRDGYSVTTDVFIGDLEDAVEHEIKESNTDFVCYVKHAAKESITGKNHFEVFERLMQRYPGRIMVM